MHCRNYIITSLILILNLHLVFPQCKIITPATHICRYNTITLSTAASAFRYAWESGAGQSEDKQTVTFFYDTFGLFTVKLRMFDSTLKEICRDSFKLRVFDLPLANTDVKDSIIFCDNSTSLCFKNLSLPGADKAPLYEYQWLFGDGAASTDKDPCHFFPFTGSYYIFLKVKDTNQCENYYRKLIYLNIAPNLSPFFLTSGPDSCPQTNVTFINYTDTFGKNIVKWIWDFDDGTVDSSSVNWSNFKHTYTLNSIFSPRLTVVTKYGCRATYVCPLCARNIIFTFQPFITPQKACSDRTIDFSLTPNATISNVYWNFDDPPSGTSNMSSGWNTTHLYSGPGTYSPAIHISQGDCKMDTVLCDHITILGPKAIINKAGKRNSYMNRKRITQGEFDQAFGCCPGLAKDSIIYTTFIKTAPFISAYDTVYCNAGILSKTAVKKNCGYDTLTVIGPPSLLNLIYDSFRINYHVAYPWDTFPGGNIYYPPSGIRYPYNIHDTDLVKPDCSAPNYIRFTNNTLKYRGYKAIDDSPPYYSGTPGSDRCKNPSYPGASDSIQYFWHFNDPVALPCTSTKANPNKLCNFSTEEMPEHLFMKNGCYWVNLTAYDPVTKCVTADSVRILMMPPKAGYDTSAFNYLNWYLQRLYNGNGIGFLLAGNPCLNSLQLPDFSKTKPDCEPEDWGIVFDSAKDCKRCCTDTLIYDRDGDYILDTIIHHTDTCRWVNSRNYGTLYRYGYRYDSSGCKTIGVFIKVGECADTFWFHNYKNILYYDARFHFYYPANDSSTIQNAISACAPFKPTVIIDKPYQEGVTDYYYTLKRIKGPPGYPNYQQTIHCNKRYDTAYRLCLKDSFYIDPVTKDSIFTNCILYPDFSCTGNSFGNMSISSLLSNYFIKDTLYLLDLTDTLTFPDSLRYPGEYELQGFLVGAYGCMAYDGKIVGIGSYASFVTSDTIYCKGDTVFVFDSIGYYGNGFYNSRLFFEWDFDGDSIWELQNTHDPVWFYSQPGKYKIRLHVIDSICGTEKYFETPSFIYINGIEADFDTFNSPGICAPQVVAFQNLSKVSSHYIYIRNSSGQIIDSALIDPINFYKWDFGDSLGFHSISYLKNPQHAYYTNGVFSVWMVAQTKHGCIDTIFKKDYIRIEGPKAGFNLLDTMGCEPFRARIINLSKDVSTQIWEQGDGQQVSSYDDYGDTASLHYLKAGVYYVSLIVSDSVYDPFFKTYKRCIAKYPDFYSINVRNKVTVLPTNPSSFFGDTLICSGSEAHFTDQSDNAYKTILWDFGDGISTLSTTGKKVSNTYTLPPGTYSAYYTISHSAGGAPCPDNPKTSILHVKDVKADFNWDTNLIKPPLFCFNNLSEGGTNYFWTFEDGDPAKFNTSSVDSVCSNFRDNLGTKTVCLRVENEIKCADTICKDIENNYYYMIYVPNIFTPENSPDANDKFTITSKSIENYALKIFNRWGQLVFQSSDPNKHWDGREMISGKPCPGGTYYFVLDYNFYYLKPVNLSGTVTLIR